MQTELTADVEPIRFHGQTDGTLDLIDQTLLPVELTLITCRDVETVWEAIKLLRVRGAPAIGISAAYGVVIGMQTVGDEDAAAFWKRLDEVSDYLAGSRPTAVNLFWALDRMKRVAHELRDSGASIPDIRVALLEEAKAIHAEDREICRAIGRHGAAALSGAANFLTHCNAGGLATADYGTALAVFFTLQDDGKDLHVFVDETRPLLQGARLTAWELSQRKIRATLICDSMAAQVMREGRVEAIVTGADRIAANGDSANKIGTYSLAVLAKAHGIPFYIAAPISTFDMAIESGDEIPIEERAAEEITHGFGRQTAPAGIDVYNPAFDVTPAELIAGIITERGVISPVTREMVAQMFAAK
ncbi:S-methyl-5-thioribose-1-phosphate isomerase [Blastopirellula sp. J2-11]|uniref:S-methyl-5-thioribose-1-phosphate isomerase n=1 Tax=Blastopirellula sp. J2-11 TaxID=2943192 RepID=UPI0021C97D8A|nr:S-methyl-5-thioribose-1-phosphate isomerase [Blastopirellula sp. J2-11]UUO06762.1 S-methyl-5-thioribose-1-phosphate isomerase [Blastopirellula sp. J2-11]